ncbi:2843_t:CDS:2, partial [Acaulospora morrowiae]
CQETQETSKLSFVADFQTTFQLPSDILASQSPDDRGRQS